MRANEKKNLHKFITSKVKRTPSIRTSAYTCAAHNSFRKTYHFFLVSDAAVAATAVVVFVFLSLSLAL